MPDVRRGTVLTFDATTWTALVMLDGADVESKIPVAQWVEAQMMVASAEVAVLVYGDTNTDDGVVLGPYGGLGQQNLNTTANVTFNSLALPNNTGISQKDTGATLRNILNLDSGNNLNVGRSAYNGNLNLVIGNTSGAVVIYDSNINELARITAGGVLRVGGIAGVGLAMQQVTSLANLGKATLSGLPGMGGFLFVFNSSAQSAIYTVQGGAHATQEISDPANAYSITAGTAFTNIYWNGSAYELENRTGGALSYYISYLGN